MALDTKIDIEDENKAEMAKVYVAGKENKEDNTIEIRPENGDIHIHIEENAVINDLNNEYEMKISACGTKTKDKSLEHDSLLDENDKELLDTFIYNFKLSDNQIIIDVTEEPLGPNNVVQHDKESKKEAKPIKQNSTESEMSMDDTIRRVLAKVEKIKIQRRTERQKRERLKCLYLVVAVAAILALAFAVVGVRVLLSPLPKIAPDRELPTHQWVMDWDLDWPESIVKERKIPSKIMMEML
eukprot:TRINITY_DN16625_c0_g1_i2.p1 TRINITY_DN16625_c0_g1~~TRINITY_DN16625_c0_g1_i2.p1  ORF type:complete len:241 (-),score=81.42 TRINITY_DN16625_c0_g1_i2:16-738(-)